MTLFRRAALVVGLIGGLGLAALPAQAQNACFARAQAIAKAMEMAEDDDLWRQTVRLF